MPEVPLGAARGPWLKLFYGILNDPKVEHLSRLLAVNEASAVGYVVSFWVSMPKDGTLRAAHVPGIERRMRWDGKLGTLLEALRAAQWADDLPCGGLAIHNWDHYMGSYKEALRKDKIRQKARSALNAAAERQRRKRARDRQRDVTNAVTPKRDRKRDTKTATQRPGGRDIATANEPLDTSVVAHELPKPSAKVSADHALRHAREQDMSRPPSVTGGVTKSVTERDISRDARFAERPIETPGNALNADSSSAPVSRYSPCLEVEVEK